MLQVVNLTLTIIFIGQILRPFIGYLGVVADSAGFVPNLFAVMLLVSMSVIVDAKSIWRYLFKMDASLASLYFFFVLAILTVIYFIGYEKRGNSK